MHTLDVTSTTFLPSSGARQPEHQEAVWNGVPNICERVSREGRILWEAWVEELGLKEGVGFGGS